MIPLVYTFGIFLGIVDYATLHNWFVKGGENTNQTTRKQISMSIYTLLCYIFLVPGKNVNFVFYLDSDTSLRVADEMVEQLELADYDVPFISEFIDYLIICLVPDWRPLLNEEFSSADNASTVENGSCALETEYAMENELMLDNSGRMENNLSLENRSDVDPPNRLSTNSTPVDDDNTYPKEIREEAQPIFGLALAQLLGTTEERKPHSGDSSTSMQLLGTSEEPKADSDSSWTFAQLPGYSMEVKDNIGALSTSMQLQETSKDAEADPGVSLILAKPAGTRELGATDVDSTIAERNCVKEESSTIPNGCQAVEAIGKKLLNGCTIQCLGEDDGEDDLQSEIEDIKEHYRHLFQEMTRMREMALENARKRWMRKMGKRPA